MRNLKPSRSASVRRQVDVIEFNLRAKEKIFGGRCRTSRAAAREAKIPAASSVRRACRQAITPWTWDGSLIAAHNMLWVLWVSWGRPHNTQKRIRSAVIPARTLDTRQNPDARAFLLLYKTRTPTPAPVSGPSAIEKKDFGEPTQPRDKFSARAKRACR